MLSVAVFSLIFSVLNAQNNQTECNQINPLAAAPSEVQRHFQTPQDQGGSNWCHSFVMRDLIAQKTGRILSVNHIAATGYAQDLQNRRREGRNVWADQAWYDRFMDISDLGQALSRSEGVCVQGHRNEWADATRGERMAEFNAVTERLLSRKDDSQTQRCNSVTQSPLTTSQRMNVQEISRACENALGSTLPEVAANLWRDECRRSSNLVSVSDLRVGGNEAAKNQQATAAQARQFVSDLDQQLRQRVVAVAYVPELLNGRRAPSRDAGHYSVVVGREWDAARHTCMYRIRNSWGENGCGRLIRNDANVMCRQDGTFNVTPQALQRAIQGVRYLE